MRVLIITGDLDDDSLLDLALELPKHGHHIEALTPLDKAEQTYDPRGFGALLCPLHPLLQSGKHANMIQVCCYLEGFLEKNLPARAAICTNLIPSQIGPLSNGTPIKVIPIDLGEVLKFLS